VDSASGPACLRIQTWGVRVKVIPCMNKAFGKDRTLRSDIVFAFTLALACYAAWLIRNVLVMLYVCGLFAVVLTPVVRSVSALRVGRWQPFKGYAILILLLVMAGVLTIFGFLALPPIIRDMQEFSREMPTWSRGFLEKLRHLPFADRVDAEEIDSRIQDFVSNAATYLWLRSAIGRASFSRLSRALFLPFTSSWKATLLIGGSFPLSRRKAATGWTEHSSGRGPDG